MLTRASVVDNVDAVLGLARPRSRYALDDRAKFLVGLLLTFVRDCSVTGATEDVEAVGRPLRGKPNGLGCDTAAILGPLVNGSGLLPVELDDAAAVVNNISVAEFSTSFNDESLVDSGIGEVVDSADDETFSTGAVDDCAAVDEGVSSTSSAMGINFSVVVVVVDGVVDVVVGVVVEVVDSVVKSLFDTTSSA